MKSHVFFYSLIMLALSGIAQQNNSAKYYYTMPFDLDSLRGFDENAAARAAISEQFVGAELKVRMYQLKRHYINEKYGLVSNMPSAGAYNQSPEQKIVSAACVNEDFEATVAGPITGTNQVVNGWTLTAGTHTTNATYNSCNLLGCCPAYVNESAIITVTSASGYIDPVIGAQYPIYSVFGPSPGPVQATASNSQIPGGMFGNTFIRLNSSMNNYSIEKLSKTFLVGTSNTLLRFAFINVISCGHACCDASSFKVQLTNATTNSVISSASYSVSGLSAACNNTSWVTYYNPGGFTPASSSSQYIYNPWQFNFINLIPYLGQNVTIDVIASDCTAGGHYSYAYFDAQCTPLGIEVNGVPGNTLSCVNSATVSGPANMPNYHWVGPASFSSSSQSFTTSTQGNYTLTLDQLAPLPSAQLVLNLQIAAPNLQVSSSSQTICEGESVQLNASGALTYTWSTGSNNPLITVNPGSTSTYTLSGTSAEGCTASYEFTQYVDQCAGLESSALKQSYCRLYPNPNKGQFNLELGGSESDCLFIVRDLSGREVYRGKVQSGVNQLKLQGLESGVYQYQVLKGESVLAKGRFNVE
ncbi:MAG TPA: T9SS type A sorting domain-containing protein [Bacteroidia bacterium]|nr:T9SS type A sorting domain-containing protein [Bacteroidia bacterium]